MIKQAIAVVTMIAVLLLALILAIPLVPIYLIMNFIIAPAMVWSIYQLTGKKAEIGVGLNGNKKTKTKKRK